MKSVLAETDVWKKMNVVGSLTLDDLAPGSKSRPELFVIPEKIGRDLKVVAPEALPPKKGLSYSEGQARLLHDLAGIELQAMELCFRTLIEFPEAPEEFRDELLRLTQDEAKHLEACLTSIDSLGFKWGDWDVHTVLWQAVSSQDSLLDRILIVHRYLEGSGLDAGDSLLKRLNGVTDGVIHKAIRMIVNEEVDHVLFGGKWYRRLCQEQGLDPELDFFARTEKLRNQLPRRVEPISESLRKKAGFTDNEIVFMKKYRDSLIKK